MNEIYEKEEKKGIETFENILKILESRKGENWEDLTKEEITMLWNSSVKFIKNIQEMNPDAEIEPEIEEIIKKIEQIVSKDELIDVNFKTYLKNIMDKKYSEIMSQIKEYIKNNDKKWEFIKDIKKTLWEDFLKDEYEIIFNASNETKLDDEEKDRLFFDIITEKLARKINEDPKSLLLKTAVEWNMLIK